MQFNQVYLESIAYSLPDDCWTSESIEERLNPLYERLKLPHGRLELMTGIAERRFWKEKIRPSEASALAGKAVLEKTGLKQSQIELLVHTAVCRDRLEPATASYVHGLLGFGGDVQIFDISNACLGFLNAIVMVGGLIESGQIKGALLVAGENGKPLVENTIQELLKSQLDRNAIKPYFANLTIGAGSVAAVLCHKSLAKPGAAQVLGGIVETDTSHNQLCEGDSAGLDGLIMQTDSEELLNAGIGVGERAWGKFKQMLHWDESTPDRVICHQVGRAHQRRLYQALQLDLAKDFSTYEKLGNVGSVSVPISLARAVESGAVEAGNKVALLGIGSGLSSIMLGLQY